MKTLGRLCAALVLTLVLALSVSAGEMSTTVVPPAPPTSTATTEGDMSTTVAGDMTTGVAGQMTTGVTTTDPATGAALNLLLNLLSLL